MAIRNIRRNRIIAVALSSLLLLGGLAWLAPLGTRAVEIRATDAGFNGIAYDEEGGTAFTSGASIRVVNRSLAGQSGAEAVYTTNGTTWTTNHDVLWYGSDDNTFLGIFPADAGYEAFTLPTDQSDGVGPADWMTATYTGSQGDGDVELEFRHLLTKVTITVTSWGSAYPDGSRDISQPLIYTTATDIQKNDSDEAEGKTSALTGVIPCGSSDGQPTYTAILCPGTYTESQTFMTFTLNGETTHTVLAGGNQALTADGLEPGKHYSFTLAVGDDAVLLSQVSVTPWTEATIAGGVAGEVTSGGGTPVPVLGIDGTAMTDEALQAAVAAQLAAGTTDLVITLTAEPTTDTLTAIRRAICDATVADGSIHLTLNGVETMPDCDSGLGSSFSALNGTTGEQVTELASVSLPHALYLGRYTFDGCENLTSISMPALQTIGHSALRSTGLTAITVPAGVTTIEDYAFANCDNLVTIDFAYGSQLESIGKNVFEGTAITTITLPAGMTTLADRVFFNCTTLTSIEIPAGITTIGTNVFKGCTSLTSVTLKANQVVSCATIPFNGADALTAIYVPADLVEAYQSAANWKEHHSELIRAIPAGN